MIRGELTGDTETVASIDSDMRVYLDTIRAAVRRIGLRHESIIKTQKLSGQVLNRRSGRLSAGVTTNFTETENSVSASTGIGPELRYGMWHEYGGTFTVRAHMRTIRQAFGRPITPRAVQVKAHPMTLPQRSWLRSTLRERREADIQELRTAIERVRT